jgi:hypothetical protein
MASLKLSHDVTGLGGALDLVENGRLTKEHMWNDGLFIILLAIFLALVIQ